MGTASDQDAYRYRVLQAAGPDGFAEIRRQVNNRGISFDQAVDEYGRALAAALKIGGRGQVAA